MAEFHWTPMRSFPSKGSLNVGAVLEAIAEAMRLAGDAELAHRLQDKRAERLWVAAECAHCDVLRGICALSEAEADSVEPYFTELELRLLRLQAARVVFQM